MKSIIVAARVASLTAILLSSVGCQTAPYSFVNLAHSPGTYAASAPPLTDAIAINYANTVAEFLRKKATGARITREVSNSAALTLATLAAPGTEVFGFSQRTGSVLGLASTGILDFQGIFNAKGRSEAAGDGVRYIEEAMVEYLSYNQSPSATSLTQNGVTLLQRTTASVHLVEMVLRGTIPSPEEMEKATEPMSQTGATTTHPGSLPQNNIPANPRAVSEREAARFSAPREVETRTTPIPSPPPLAESQLRREFQTQYKFLTTKEPSKQTEILNSVFQEVGIEGSPDQVSAIFGGASLELKQRIIESLAKKL